MTLETKKIRPYVGIKKDGRREVFQASQGPTEELYGDLYSAVIGPFKTQRGANFMVQYGTGNPHLQTVEDAERIARQEERKERAARKPRGKPVNIDCTELHTWFERDRAYDYAKERGMLPVVLPHYIAMSGQHGCLPDHCEVFETHKAAVEDLVQLFELGRTRKARLCKDSYLELTPNPVEENQGEDFGAEYCEITECDCDNPLVHSDSH